MARNLQVLQSFPLAKIWSTVKGNIPALRFSDPGALYVDVSSAPALLLDLQHLPLLQSRSPCTANPSTTVLLLVSCAGQETGHFVASLLIAPTLLVMMSVPSRGYSASLSLLSFHLFTALCLLVTLTAPMTAPPSTNICQHFYSWQIGHLANQPSYKWLGSGKNPPLNLAVTTQAP